MRGGNDLVITATHTCVWDGFLNFYSFLKCDFFSRFLLRYTSPDFLYVRSWLPCIFFSGGVTVGNIGRQLAMVKSASLDHSLIL